MRDGAGRLVDWAAPGHESVCGVTTQVFSRPPPPCECPVPDSWSLQTADRIRALSCLATELMQNPRVGLACLVCPAMIKGPNKGERHLCILGRNQENGQKYIKADALAGIQIRLVKEVYFQPSD